MRPWLRWLAPLAIVIVWGASTNQAGAQPSAATRPGAGGALDRAIGARAAARRIAAEARSQLIAALDEGRDDALGPADETQLDRAIARYQVVLGVFPNEVDAWLEMGLALSRFRRTEPDGRISRRVDEAISALVRARALEPTREASWLAFELAVLHTEQRDYRGAAQEYERALAAETPYPAALEYPVSGPEEILVYLFAAPGPPTILGNWAEVLMLEGELDGAIAMYRRAFGASPPDSAAGALALWGLALAEERAGSHADALGDARRAIEADPIAHGTPAGAALIARHSVFAPLHLAGVFFEPACEIHAYEALGHEALAAAATSDEARTRELSAALRSTRYFLAEGGRDSIHAVVAERSEERLSRALAPAPSEPPAPSERRRPQRERAPKQ